MAAYDMHYTLIATLLVFVVWLLWRNTKETYARETKKPTIFVSIPAYRDADCAQTVVHMFETAADPSRVYAGMCVQTTGSETESCLPPDFKWHSNVRILRIPHTEAKGPTYARAMCASLYRGESWFLGIDSHTKWAEGWDATLLDMIKQCDSKKPVLSQYPPAWDDTSNDADGVPVLCKVNFNEAGAPALGATIRKLAAPQRIPYVAGGFMFGPGSIATEVKFDPTLDHLWIPEEFLLSARLYTHGYDVFAPTKSVAYHYYERQGAPRWHGDNPTWHAAEQNTLKKVLRLLEGHNPEYTYGMGTQRSLREYYRFAGIDWQQKKMIPKREKELCG